MQLGAIWCSYRPDLYNNFSPFLVGYPIDLRIDVYSYNFSNDKQVVKCLGKPPMVYLFAIVTMNYDQPTSAFCCRLFKRR